MTENQSKMEDSKALNEVAARSVWLHVQRDLEENTTFKLHSLYTAEAKKAQEADDQELANFYQTLASVFSMYFSPEDPKEPFRPLWVMGSRRSLIPEDFDLSDLDMFEQLATQSENPIFKARINDVLWLRRRQVQYAKEALEDYISYAEKCLVPGGAVWIEARDTLERACQLCRQLGGQKEYEARIVSLLNEKADLDEKEPNYFKVFLARIACKYRFYDDADVWQARCIALSDQAKAEKDFERAKDLLSCAGDFARVSKDFAKADKIKEVRAMLLVEEAREIDHAGASGLIIALKYSEAIAALRTVSGKRDLIDELEERMIDANKKAVLEMKPISVPVDVTDAIKSGKEAVSGVEPMKALRNIAAMAQPLKHDALKERVLEMAQKFPLQHLISSVALDDNGRVVNRKPGIEASESDAGIRSRMIELCLTNQKYVGYTQIEAARESLWEGHAEVVNALRRLVEMSSFVPVDRRELMFRGLKAGFLGDSLVSTHLLVPQIENGIRHVMELSGKLVTSLDADVVQKERDLNSLLYDPSAIEFFGKDLIFSLQSFLIENVGGNYRNELAHGMLSDESFDKGWSNYLWALTLRLCILVIPKK